MDAGSARTRTHLLLRLLARVPSHHMYHGAIHQAVVAQLSKAHTTRTHTHTHTHAHTHAHAHTHTAWVCFIRHFVSAATEITGDILLRTLHYHASLERTSKAACCTWAQLWGEAHRAAIVQAPPGEHERVLLAPVRPQLHVGHERRRRHTAHQHTAACVDAAAQR